MDASTPKKPFQYYMRATHRILGYLVLGLVMVYSLSGIILVHRTGNFMKKGTPVELVVEPNLNADQLASALKLKGIKVTDETAQTIFFADGQYNKTTGQVAYIKREVVAPFNVFIDLHKMPSGKDPYIGVVSTVFGSMLFLLALTALFMFKPSARQFKANMLYLSLGLIIAVLLLFSV